MHKMCIIDEIEVNTKRERRASNNKNQNNNQISKQPVQTQAYSTLGALVTGLTIIQQPSIGLNNSSSTSLPTKNGHEDLSTSQQDHGVDSGLSSEITNTETEKPAGSGDDELSSTSGTSSTLAHTDHSTHQRESSPSSGVVIPEEKRVTDHVKVFEAVAKNGNKKKPSSSSFSTADQKQVSPLSTDSFDSQSINETKSSKNKSKKSSLKKQIQNLLKIDKPTSLQDDLNAMDEHQQLNGKKNKKDNNSAFKPLEIQIPNNEDNSSSSTVSKLINTFQTNDSDQPIVVSQINTPPPPPPSSSLHPLPIQSENVSYVSDKKITCGSFVLSLYIDLIEEEEFVFLLMLLFYLFLYIYMNERTSELLFSSA
ncbi:unnamed protein product [Adineta ricciae]|uniref:Uncharacterized protein n=1 Tax=Adineta ricciae TaxID=249248 RepID=A0A815EK47_ADIRI|nr:unnamed protein product [Adineta ricciae]